MSWNGERTDQLDGMAVLARDHVAVDQVTATRRSASRRSHMRRSNGIRYVGFEVNRGNIGRRAERGSPIEPRTAAALTLHWNRALTDRRVPLRIFPTYGHTGNYRIAAEQALPVADVQTMLSDTLGGDFAVFTVTDFVAWVTAAQGAAVRPAVPPGRRPTLGAVMDLNTAGQAPPIVTSDSRWVFDAFAVPRVRAVWKIDLEAPGGGRLDSSPRGREGGWGSIVPVMRRHCGGRWTARAISTLKGVVEVVRTP